MATYTSRTVTNTRREWVVPAAQPWGATMGDVSSATAAAAQAWREHFGANPVPDDGLRFHVTDEAIVISFTFETPQP